MKQFTLILFACLLFLACNEKKQYAPSYYPRVTKKDTAKVEKKADTLNVEQQQQPEPPSKSPETKKPAPTTTKKKYTPAHSSVSSSSSKSSYDNMRGFDPAFEDDMDDNGMSRYMDNTDDEGWD